MITAVFFDAGGTILDELREFAGWAGWLGVPRHPLSAGLGAVLDRPDIAGRAHFRVNSLDVIPGLVAEHNR